MKTIRFIAILFACALAGGCVNVKEGGKVVFHCSAKAKYISYTSPAGSKLVISDFAPEAVHKAIGGAIGQGMLSAGTAVATSGVTSLIKP